MTTIKVIILPNFKAKEVNPLGEKPKLEDYPQSLSAEAAYEEDIINWYESESNLREFDIENPFILVETSCLKYEGKKTSQTLSALSVGSIHTAEIISPNKIRIK